MITDRAEPPRLLMMSPPSVAGGPMPKIVPEIRGALCDRGFAVEDGAWGGRGPAEGWLAKGLGRFSDAWGARRFLLDHPGTSMLVHTSHDWRTVPRDLLLLTLCRSVAKSTVLVLHGSSPARVMAHPRSLFSKLTRTTFRRADAIAVLSSEEKRSWSELLPAVHIAIVRNPVRRPDSVTNRSQSPTDRTHILFVGRLIPSKGCSDLLIAFDLVRRSIRSGLRIVGDGPEASALARQARDLGILDDVVFTGNLTGDALEQEYAHAAALVLPSYNEGLPTVVLEAMVRGVPVVTTRIGGSADYFSDMRDVLFVPPKEPEAIAAALRRLFDGSDLRSRLTETARKTVAQFDRLSVASDYERLLDTALRVAERRRARP